MNQYFNEFLRHFKWSLNNVTDIAALNITNSIINSIKNLFKIRYSLQDVAVSTINIILFYYIMIAY